VWFAALVFACADPPELIDETCVPGPLLAGEVRAKIIACREEITPSGEADIGDFLLENSVVRFGIRDATQTLTRLQGTGGTIVDAALPEGTDFIIEAVALTDEQWFEQATVSAWNEPNRAGIVVSGTLMDGRQHTVSYILAADSAALEIRGADVLELVPMTGSGRIGDTLETPADDAYVVLAGGVPIEDDGGWVRWRNIQRWWVGSRERVYRGLWPEGHQVRGTSDGSWVLVESNESRWVARTPVSDGAFALWSPPDENGLLGQKSGHALSALGPGEDGVHLAIGGDGFIALEVTNEDGEPIPATLTWNDKAWAFLPGDSALPVGPGAGSGFVDAGPAYERETIDELQVEGEISITVQLARAVSPSLLAKTDVVVSPDRTERRSSDTILREATATGVGFAIAIADDEIGVASPGDSTKKWIRAQTGSRSDGEHGHPIAWPWSSSTSRPAHGAAPWMDLDAQSLLAVMNKNGGRWSAIDVPWATAAGNPAGWVVQPEAIQLNSFAELGAYLALLDAWQPITPLGPLTWIDGSHIPPQNDGDTMRGLLTGQTTATTGPRLLLTVDGMGPGEPIEGKTGLLRELVLTVEAAPRFELTHAGLFGPGGEIVMIWALDGKGSHRLTRRTQVGSFDYIVAATWDDSQPETGDWAITAPIWGSRP
jgi:hypothetical protein